MKKKLIFIILILFPSSLFAGYGSGDLTLTDGAVRGFHKYITDPKGSPGRAKPLRIVVSHDGSYVHWFYCAYSQCVSDGDSELVRICERKQANPCSTFAVGRSVKWKNGINPGGKAASFKKSMTLEEVREKLTQLGFYGSSNVDKIKKNTSTNKKKYSLKGERSIALQWEGYSDLIAGTINFDEKNYQGTLKLPLPNNDGTCNGSYTLQEGGNGVWQMTCTNNKGASGTLKWDGSGGVTGKGRDYKNKKLKFTVAKKS